MKYFKDNSNWPLKDIKKSFVQSRKWQCIIHNSFSLDILENESSYKEIHVVITK